LAPVHLDVKFLEIVPSFDDGAPVAIQHTKMVFLTMDPATMPATTTIKAKALRRA